MATCLERELRQILPLPKETDEEASRRRSPRKKTRVIRRRFPTPLPRAESTDFAYVLQDVQEQKISFGSTSPRNIGIYGKGAPYSRIIFKVRRETDKSTHLGPTTYDTPTKNAFYKEVSKVTSTHGVGIGARRAKRFPEQGQGGPGPADYHHSRPPPKENPVPFNSSAQKKPLVSITKYPGPGAYHRGGVIRSLWRYHFGAAPREPVPLVTICCTNGRPLGKCAICEEELPSGKEYWRNAAEKLQLCIRCMRVEKQDTAKKRFTHWQLQAFQRERDCTDYHEHEGTTAKIQLFPVSVIQKRLRLEAYLGRFFVDDGPPDDPDRDKRPAILVDRPDRHRKEPLDGCGNFNDRPDCDCIDLCFDIPSISMDESTTTTIHLGDLTCFQDI